MTSNAEKGLKSLQVWQRSIQLAVLVCKHIIPKLPIEEKYALANQVRRSVQSISANIAEAYGRYYYQESIRFCYIARGSLEETHSHLTLAHMLGYLDDDEYSGLMKDMANIHKLLNGYIGYLKQSKRGANEPGSQLSIREGIDPYSLNELDASLIPDPESLIPDDAENL
jgi:four helix bundle protein